jgi:hypothetical protein
MSSTRMNPTEGPTPDVKKQKVYYVRQTKNFGFFFYVLRTMESDPFSQYALNK